MDHIQRNMEILRASGTPETEEAFNTIFEVVDDARSSGNLLGLVDLIQCVLDQVGEVDPDIPIWILRLTATMRHAVYPEWTRLRDAVKEDLVRRGEETDKLLHGLL
jgi:hypothetical protein